MEQLSVPQTDQRSAWAILLEKELLRLLEPFGFQRGGTATVWFFSSAVCGTWRTLPPLQWILNIPEAARGSSAMLYPLAGENIISYRSHTTGISALWGDLCPISSSGDGGKWYLVHGLVFWIQWGSSCKAFKQCLATCGGDYFLIVKSFIWSWGQCFHFL